MRSPHSLKAGRRARPANEDTRWIWGRHAALAALANPLRRIDAVLATRNAMDRLPRGITAELTTPNELDRLLPAGAAHQGLAVRADARASLEGVLSTA